ncbi:MAG: sugar phosphate isomerase/epimerase [Geopsychrobacter sp.]|nr:sugar phosphate isomerase/epimerase [Geopsychrobacter sp.]
MNKLEERLDDFLAEQWQPELALQTSGLDNFTPQDSIDLHKRLQAAGLHCTIHAPFFDLNPASSDPDIRAITARRFEQTIEFAARVEASRIVFHPGYDPWRYARTPNAWLENSLEFWPALLARSASNDILICLENIFDTRPDPLVDLLHAINSPYMRHCFDIGHWFLFSKTPIELWLTAFEPFLAHLHLHDNRRRKDDHRPIGKGKIDFEAFFNQLRQLDSTPTATLEAHNQQDAELSLTALQALLK